MNDPAGRHFGPEEEWLFTPGASPPVIDKKRSYPLVCGPTPSGANPVQATYAAAPKGGPFRQASWFGTVCLEDLPGKPAAKLCDKAPMILSPHICDHGANCRMPLSEHSYKYVHDHGAVLVHSGEGHLLRGCNITRKGGIDLRIW
ncbi:hypothetical protein AcidC75_12360 [Acidisoma sp. C75]